MIDSGVFIWLVKNVFHGLRCEAIIWSTLAFAFINDALVPAECLNVSQGRIVRLIHEILNETLHCFSLLFVACRSFREIQEPGSEPVEVVMKEWLECPIVVPGTQLWGRWGIDLQWFRQIGWTV